MSQKSKPDRRGITGQVLLFSGQENFPEAVDHHISIGASLPHLYFGVHQVQDGESGRNSMGAEELDRVQARGVRVQELCA